MSDTMQPDEQSLDRNWLAFRYVAEELNAGEIAEFENLLAESQSAREAVAAAVLLSQAVELAGSSQPARAATVNPVNLAEWVPQWRVRLTWGLVGAAASLLLAWSLQSWRDAARTVHPGVGTRQSDHEDLNNLAIQWTAARGFDSENGSDLTTGNDPAADRRESGDLILNRTGISVALVDDVSDDVSAPDWLLAAVSATSEPPPSKPRPDRNP